MITHPKNSDSKQILFKKSFITFSFKSEILPLYFDYFQLIYFSLLFFFSSQCFGHWTSGFPPTPAIVTETL